MSSYRLTLILSLMACLLVVGCRAKPAPDSGFLQQPKLMKADGAVPFNRMYVNPQYAHKSFTEVYVAPVNTNYVMAENIWEQAALANVSPEGVKANVQMLADYLRQAFIKELKNDPKKRYKVVDTPGPNTLLLEMALVQLVPSKAELQALSLVPVGFYGVIGTGVMVGGSMISHSEDQGKGVIAMEARTRDGSSGDIVLMFADREHPPTAILDLKSLLWWEPAKPICDGWAKQFVQLETSPPGTKIQEIPNFQLLVW
jgi:hypothetical protein